MTTNAPTAVTTVKKVGRPARKQAEEGEVKSRPPPQTGQIYNIWFHKWAGGDSDSRGVAHLEKATHKVHIKRDSGYTQADKTGKPYVCLLFARGRCSLGVMCERLHRLPDPTKFVDNLALDCFGREKHAEYRSDMGGVGSFHRQNRTLYVAQYKEQSSAEETKEIVSKAFEEFGEIETLRLLNGRSYGFLTFKYEVQAQFAKEAMACQSLEDDEILNIRWAYEDPNLEAQRNSKRRFEKEASEMMAKKLAENDVLLDAVRRMDALEQGKEYGNGVSEGNGKTQHHLPAPEAVKISETSGLFDSATLASMKQLQHQKPITKEIPKKALIAYAASDSE